jgi:hypothetical protein
LYYPLTSAGTGVVWKFNDVVSGPEIGDPDAERIRERQNLQHERNRLAVEKYRRRRFKFSDYIAYYELSATSNTVRSRYIGDSESFVLGRVSQTRARSRVGTVATDGAHDHAGPDFLCTSGRSVRAGARSAGD